MNYYVECASTGALLWFAHTALWTKNLPNLQMFQVALNCTDSAEDDLKVFEETWDTEIGWGHASKDEAYDLSGGTSFVVVTYSWRKPRSGVTASAIHKISIKCSSYPNERLLLVGVF